MDRDLQLYLAKRATGLEVSADQPLPEHITRGLGRTTIIGRDTSGLPISAEGTLVAEQMRINQDIAKKSKTDIEKLSPIGQLRFDLIESETERLLPFQDEMNGAAYTISPGDARSVVETSLQEIDRRGMFIKRLDYDQIEAVVDEINEYLVLGGHEVTITKAIDATLAISAKSKLIEIETSKGE